MGKEMKSITVVFWKNAFFPIGWACLCEKLCWQFQAKAYCFAVIDFFYNIFSLESDHS